MIFIMKKIITNSLAETKQFGFEFAKTVRSGDIVLLSGEMGAGKTVFTKGLAEGLNITNEITSPTFSLMNVYEVTNNTEIKKLIHIDTYRLEDEGQLMQIGAEDYIGQKNTVSVIEWPEKLKTLLDGKNVIKIEIKHLDNESREIILK